MKRAKLRSSLREVDLKIQAAMERIADQERLIQKIPPSRGDLAAARELLRIMIDALKALQVFRQALVNALAVNSLLLSPQHDAVRHGRVRPQEGNNRAAALRVMHGRRPRLRARLYAAKRCRLVNGGVAWSGVGPLRLQSHFLKSGLRLTGRGPPCPRR
ncbi:MULTISPECIES: hypothetical protein [unclassified Achromobacter]|uniref:hypothetical protein n=1 Tax=unclassified Achromobacter TaxID=2626865 RepID=UPI0011779F48|nr:MULTISPECIES: hypothetical protein [unclassified Achromobacter]